MNKKTLVSAMISTVMVSAMSFSAFAAQDTVKPEKIRAISTVKINADMENLDQEGECVVSATTLEDGVTKTELMDLHHLEDSSVIETELKELQNIELNGKKIIVNEEEDGVVSILFEE